MRILSIDMDKSKNRGTVTYQVALDNGEKTVLTADTVLFFQLHPDDEINEERLRDICAHDEEKIIIQQSIGLISRRIRSEKELRDRFLRKGFSGTAADNAIVHLRDQGYLDDGHFARLFAKQLLKKKPVGEIKLRYELRKKGINDPVTEQIISELMENQCDLANQAALKKLKTLKAEDINIIRQKLRRFLEQRGFTGEIVRKTVDSVI